MNKKRRLSEDIADSILERILEMGIGIGDKLPTHQKLADDLGVSLPSLREGLSVLSLSGVIRISHGSGTILSVPRPEDYFKIISYEAKIHGIDFNTIGSFCSLFVQDITELLLKDLSGSITTLERIIEEGEKGMVINFLALQKDFHLSLANKLENMLKKDTLTIILDLNYSKLSIVKEENIILDQSIDAHKCLLNGIKTIDRTEVGIALDKCYNANFTTGNDGDLSMHRKNTDSVCGGIR